MSWTAAYKKILVPIDFSPCALLALENARQIATKAGARIHLIHAWEIAWVHPEVSVVSGDQLVSLAEHTRLEAEDRMQKLVPGEASANISSSVRRGHPSDVVVSCAREESVDLIVMGTHGRTGLSHLILGSVAQKVLRRAPCPVLTCPKHD